jgi:hypothetical protein
MEGIKITKNMQSYKKKCKLKKTLPNCSEDSDRTRFTIRCKTSGAVSCRPPGVKLPPLESENVSSAHRTNSPLGKIIITKYYS